MDKLQIFRQPLHVTWNYSANINLLITQMFKTLQLGRILG